MALAPCKQEGAATNRCKNLLGLPVSDMNEIIVMLRQGSGIRSQTESRVPCNAPDPCRSRPEESTRESLAEASSLAQPLHDWLLELDSVGFLMDYHSSLKQRHFSCPAEVAKAYAQGGRLDDRFFRDLSVRKLGHRRLFEKWCRGLVSEHLAASR
ncbi:unnamed protein product [Polarella glacialis]|uniref:Uncharacterized protein n=1 Tax=Polarella glacialis TaxID=89957 RepID=A0A813KKS8_POLGL|nr:unnamed protein product [Polarella glacialis]